MKSTSNSCSISGAHLLATLAQTPETFETLFALRHPFVHTSGTFLACTLVYAHSASSCRTRLSGLPSSHVWPFQSFFATDKAAYLIRQHIFSNLYHRLSTRPFLASLEKVTSWLDLQSGLAQLTFSSLVRQVRSHDFLACFPCASAEAMRLTSPMCRVFQEAVIPHGRYRIYTLWC